MSEAGAGARDRLAGATPWEVASGDTGAVATGKEPGSAADPRADVENGSPCGEIETLLKVGSGLMTTGVELLSLAMIAASMEACE